jgi:hypothetical protein
MLFHHLECEQSDLDLVAFTYPKRERRRQPDKTAMDFSEPKFLINIARQPSWEVRRVWPIKCLMLGGEPMNTSTNHHPSASPLETLVIQQLTHLIHDEQVLATQYPELNSKQDSPEQREAFFSGLAQLRRRAERLQRFMDALDNFGLAAAAGSATPALAR